MQPARHTLPTCRKPRWTIFREMMDLNYFGTVHMVKALVPAMVERGSGYIVNFSSGRRIPGAVRLCGVCSIQVRRQGVF